MDDLLANNLDNVREDVDLFGATHKRLSVMDRIGFVPVSIWRPDWNITKTLKEVVGDSGQTRELVGNKMALPGSKYTTSIFNPHLAQMILSAYCPPAANIYDAFGGGGTRGFIAAAMGHTYTGVEVRQEEVDRIIEKQAELGMEFEMVCADSGTYKITPDSYDFSYSCPPYYDLEVYSTLKDDISHAPTYGEFLEGIHKSLEVTFWGLKSGSTCVWVVGNFRNKRGRLVHFNGDVIRIAEGVGFQFHDEIVFWGASGAAALRAGQFAANRKSVRVHEYVLVFIKP